MSANAPSTNEFPSVLTLRCFRFMQAAQLPDDLEMILEEDQLSVRIAHCVFHGVCFECVIYSCR